MISVKKSRLRLAKPIAAVIVIASAGACIAMRPANPKRGEGPAPSTRSKVHAIGRLEPSSTVIRLAGPGVSVGSRIEQLLVNEGESVSPGALIAPPDTFARRESAVAEAETHVDSALARLDQIKAGAKASEIAARNAAISRFEVAFLNAERERKRTDSPARRCVATEESRDDSATKFDSARLELQQARATLAGLTEVRAVDVKNQESEIQKARAVVKRTIAELDAARVRSPIAGHALKLHE